MPPKSSRWISPPPYSYFQTALHDPLAAAGQPPHAQPPLADYVPPALRHQPQPRTTLTLAIGSAPSKRTWILPRTLLAKHSTHLATLCANPFRTHATLGHIDPHAFANFADYMHSSIYSLNSQVDGFKSIAAGLRAVELGKKLGAPAYVSAAVRRLHVALEPLARLESSERGKDKSLIHADDVRFVCTRDVGAGAKLLIFHAVVAHWKQIEAVQMREDSGWAKVCDECGEFERVVMGSKEMEDGVRGMYLAGVEMYLDWEREKRRVREEERKKGMVREVVLGRLRGGVGRWGRSARGRADGGSANGSANGAEESSAGVGEGLRGGVVEQAVPSGLSENDWMVVDTEGEEEL